MENDIDINNFRKELGITSPAHASMDRRKWTTKIKSQNSLPETDFERVREMRLMRYEKVMTLQEIGDSFGISRERVRQILKDPVKIKGKPNPILQERKRRKKEFVMSSITATNKELSEKMGISKNAVSLLRGGTRHAVENGCSIFEAKEIEEFISRILSEHGIKHEMMSIHHPFDILLENGKRVDVKAAFTNSRPPSLASKLNVDNLYNFQIGKTRRGEYADFFICVIVTTGAIFVIPGQDAPKWAIRINWPAPNGRVSKFAKYLNAFDLLANP